MPYANRAWNPDSGGYRNILGGAGGSCRIEGLAVDGHAFAAQLDTCFTGTLVVYDAAIERLGLRAASVHGRPQSFPYTDGGVTLNAAPSGRITFAGSVLASRTATVYFPAAGKNPVHQPDGLFEATVGNALFAHSVVTLDFKSMSVYVRTQRPSWPSTADQALLQIAKRAISEITKTRPRDWMPDCCRPERVRSSIILNASMVSIKGMPAFSVYAASKAALRSFARSWIVDLKDRQIRVNVVSPGTIPTPAYDQLGLTREQMMGFIASQAAAIPLGRVGVPDEIAKAVLFLASDDSSFVNGIELFVDGGMAQI